MKAKQTLSQMVQVMGRSCNTISRKVKYRRDDRGYRVEPACAKGIEGAKGGRNTRRITVWEWSRVAIYFAVQWSAKQIVHMLPLSYESVSLHDSTDKAKSMQLHKELCSQGSKYRRCLSDLDLHEQIPGCCTTGEYPTLIKGRKQAPSHSESDTVTRAGHQQAIATLTVDKEKNLFTSRRIKCWAFKPLTRYSVPR